jgi:hypothetical protein
MGDTGAGRHLGSIAAFTNQGVPEKVVKSATRETQFPIQFETGGGEQGGRSTISVSCHDMKHDALLYLLDSCPLALSIGQVVNESGLPFIWVPGELPFFAKPGSLKWSCAKTNRINASRVYQNVPMFEFEISIVPGLPAKLSVKPNQNNSDDDGPSTGESTASSSSSSSNASTKVDDNIDDMTLADLVKNKNKTNKDEDDKPHDVTVDEPTHDEIESANHDGPTLVEFALDSPEYANMR